MTTKQITLSQAVQIAGNKERLIDLSRTHSHDGRSMQVLLCTGAKLSIGLVNGRVRCILGGYHQSDADTNDILEAIGHGLRGLIEGDRLW